MAENQDATGQPSLTPVPRRNIASPSSSAADPSAREQLADIVDSVKVLANQLHHDDAADAGDARTRAVRRQKKFQRAAQADERRAEPPETPVDLPAAEAETPSSPDPAQEPPDAAALNRNIAWPRLSRPNVPATLVRAKRKRRSTTLPLLVLMGCNLVMLVLGYFVGLSMMSAPAPSPTASPASGSPGPTGSAKPETGAPRPSPGISDTAMDAADDALRAEKNGDLVVARRVYDDSLRLRVGLPGAEYRLALLAIKRGDLLDADLHLSRSTAAGECVASCAFVRATFAGAKGDYGEAARETAAAARAEPFNGKYFFCWGECLRREGKPRAAVACFQRALTRPFSAEEGDLYVFKMGLANVEVGNDEAFNASLASHLQKTAVPGDWWLLAAAQDLERSAFPAAADHLQKAAKALPPAVYDSRVRDYFFQAHVKRPELATLLNRPPTTQATEAGATVMDPAAWSPEKADPGAWPSAAR